MVALRGRSEMGEMPIHERMQPCSLLRSWPRAEAPRGRVEAAVAGVEQVPGAPRAVPIRSAQFSRPRCSLLAASAYSTNTPCLSYPLLLRGQRTTPCTLTAIGLHHDLPCERGRRPGPDLPDCMAGAPGRAQP